MAVNLPGAASFFALMLLAHAAGASVVIHDNRDGAFQWTATTYLGDGNPLYGKYLDIRQSPQQSGQSGQGTLLNWFSFGFTGSSPGIWDFRGVDGAEVAWSQAGKDRFWNGSNHWTIPLREYVSNESVSAGDRWDVYGTYFYSLPFSFDMAGGLPWIENLAYLGVRIKNGPNSYNYGWILYENWTNPLMWGYETTPNTPIQIPVPAPGAAMILGGAAGCFSMVRRPRRLGIE